MEETLAQKRARLILQVQGGQLTATEAAAQLNVSTKTYYEWQQRALDALVSAMIDRPTGRPGTEEDPEVKSLRRENADLKEKLALSTRAEEVKEMIRRELASLEAGQKKQKAR
jgi:transposase-like protein